MTTYEVRVTHVHFGKFNVRNLAELKELVNRQIENIHPLNASPEHAEEYRSRYRNQPIFYKTPDKKDWNILE